MYNNGQELLELAVSKHKKLYEIIIENECKMTDTKEADVIERMRRICAVMKESAQKALEEDVISVSGFTGGDARKVEAYRRKGKTLCGDVVVGAMAKALSCSEVNASMGKVVAAPTAGSCGILPAAVITAAEAVGASDEDMIHMLFTASGIGQIIARNATLSGAEGGCQAECGSAAAMAAAALVEYRGGTPKMSLDAAAMTLKNVMGLVCDPVAGLVEAPCAKRNAMGVMNAMMCADLALAGVQSLIPFDEVVDAMYKVGKSMPHQLRETALGGIAATPTGIHLKSHIKNKMH